jgi:large-conductance mechanosensitive channel
MGTAIGDIFAWIYNSIIMPIVTGIMLYIGLWAAVITWLWETVLSPVFAAIGAVSIGCHSIINPPSSPAS